MTEHELQSAVMDAARILGWRRAHFRAAMTKHGWRTPVEGEGKGFPDLVLVRERIVWVELKGHGGKVSPEQREWLDALDRAGAECYLWTPSSWTSGEIERVLRDKVFMHLKATPRMAVS